MDLQLAGKTAYITGGGNGIGAAIADRLTEEGVRVAVADADGAALKDSRERWTVDGQAPVLIETDLSTGDGVADAVKAVRAGFRREPDILVNNVAACVQREFLDIDDDAWQQTFQLNFMSYVRTCRALAPGMAEAGGAAIVNIASDLAKQPVPMPMDYGAMKSAVLYLSKALSQQYAPAIRVNAVLPGPVWTGLWSRPGGIADGLTEMYNTDRDTAIERYLEDRQLALGLSEPSDVASMVAYLASPLARRISGSGFDVGGTIHGLI
ncbi:SDR family NAD(P)-dependent oxidoreductase [Nocardia sp. CDC160]|uniref:SDR family NAD(P)-dependent oxidoreductase n=1 Tax=Nocardia sp. CDC160 TaxID=3112166 RepID=UPI002DBD9D00|nr:SDR family oxidoreductase [Nocardia sp. CDC160]MEC3919204.1 SDR family oxidoreductase [Nocardia sp. CDC160]